MNMSGGDIRDQILSKFIVQQYVQQSM